MTRFFCCCLPVRLGVFVLSFLQLLFAGAIAGLVWRDFIVAGPVGTERIAHLVTGIVFGLMAVAALFGFIGAMVRVRGLVQTYAVMLYCLILASVGASVFFVYTLYHSGGEQFIDTCRAQSDKIDLAQAKAIDGAQETLDNALDTICDGLLTTFKIVYIVLMVIVVLIQLYCAHIVQSYASQLDEEEILEDKQRLVSYPQPIVVAPQMVYNPHAPKMA